ncbi:MAG: segregation and condensation protein A [Candidatus Nitrospinota bacterium M3_3B_026]
MAYNVKLDVFEGPLDLLLHLIKENQVDIYDIPIADITRQYLEYLELMKSLNLDVAGEYLLMAATLTYIKSKTLLPKTDITEDEEEQEAEDPREELVARLLEYKKYKEAALRLKERELDQSMVFTRPPREEDVPPDGDLLVEVSVLELLKSLKRLLEQAGDGEDFSLTLEEISVTDKINYIMGRLEAEDSVTFDSLFGGGKNRMEVVATFLALLELMRLRLARALQTRRGGEILIYRASDEGAARDGDDAADAGADDAQAEERPEAAGENGAG